MENFKILIFKVEGGKYAINVSEISSIERYSEPTKLPNSNKSMKGVINLRGSVIPIIDLKSRLDLGSTDITDQSRLIVVNLKDNENVALLVDSANTIIDIKKDQIQEVPDLIKAQSSFLKGAFREDKEDDSDIVTILDIKKIIERGQNNGEIN